MNAKEKLVKHLKVLKSDLTKEIKILESDEISLSNDRMAIITEIEALTKVLPEEERADVRPLLEEVIDLLKKTDENLAIKTNILSRKILALQSEEQAHISYFRDKRLFAEQS